MRDWAATELGIGTIDRCVREAGIACVPVVDQLVEELQEAEILHLDETPWYVKGRLHWLWVAITTNTAVFHIGSRKKEELAHLVTEAFVGWLVTDGYKARVLTLWKKVEKILWQDLCQTKDRVKEAVQNVL